MTPREPAFTRSALASEPTPPLRQLPRMVGFRVDAFYLAFQGAIASEVKDQLTALLAEGRSVKSETAVHLARNGGELHGALSTRAHEGWWVIHSAWATVTVDERGSHNWTVEVRPTGLLLLREGPRRALEYARSIARALLEDVTAERVRRLDLCADLTGLAPKDVNVRAFVTHSRTRYQAIQKVAEYFRAGMRTGYVIGQGDMLARIYDKTEQLNQGLDEAKKADEYADWSLAGWNGRDRVTRVEFQLRGKLLEELELRDDPTATLERLDATWSYCTKKWLRLVELGTATRKIRCATDARWRVLEDVVFKARAPIPVRTRVPSAPAARRALSGAINYCAAEGLIQRRVESPRERVKDWSLAQAEAWLIDRVYWLLQKAARAAASDLINRYDDAIEAVVHLMTKEQAALARYGFSPCSGADRASELFGNAAAVAA